MDYQTIRLRNRNNVRLVSWIDMAIGAVMILYFGYKFFFSDFTDVSRPPFSPGKWRGFSEFLFSSICIVYSTQFFIALLLLSSTSRTENVENACVKNQVWICVSHFLLITLAIELFVLGFNLIRPGASGQQILTFGFGMGICLFKCIFRLAAEKCVKEYLRDIYNVPGVQFSDSVYYSRPEDEDLMRVGSRCSLHHAASTHNVNGHIRTPYSPPPPPPTSYHSGHRRSTTVMFDPDYDEEYYIDDDYDDYDHRRKVFRHPYRNHHHHHYHQQYHPRQYHSFSHLPNVHQPYRHNSNPNYHQSHFASCRELYYDDKYDAV